MAVHASLGRRNPGKTRGLDRSVAVSAINPQRGHMMLMAEWRRLWPGDAGIGHVGRALELNARPKHACQSKYPRVNGSARDDVSAAMENLHRSEFFCTAGFVIPPETNSVQVLAAWFLKTGDYNSSQRFEIYLSDSTLKKFYMN